MDKSLGTLLHFWAFSNSHRPNPSPHPTNNVGNMYPWMASIRPLQPLAMKLVQRRQSDDQRHKWRQH